MSDENCLDNLLDPCTANIIIRADDSCRRQLIAGITSEHLLIALLQEEVLELTVLLESLQISVQSVRDEAVRIVELCHYPSIISSIIELGDFSPNLSDLNFVALRNRSIAISPMVMTVLANANELARQSGRAVVSPIDLLRSLVYTNDCTACKIIENHGISAKAVLDKLQL
jgi:ATP-dependent Clp protease ATP-binding subunit ClpA